MSAVVVALVVLVGFELVGVPTVTSRGLVRGPVDVATHSRLVVSIAREVGGALTAGVLTHTGLGMVVRVTCDLFALLARRFIAHGAASSWVRRPG